MRKARLLSTVAATLLLTAGAASAQTMNKDEAPESRAGRAAEGAGREDRAGHEAGSKADQRKAPETTGQARPRRPKPDKSAATEKADMDKPAPKGPAAREVVRAKRRRRRAQMRRIARRNRTSAAPKSSRRSETQHHRSGRGGRFGQAVDRAAQQDHDHHQAAQGGTGASQHFGARGNARSGQRAFLSVAGGSSRDLSRVARL